MTTQSKEQSGPTEFSARQPKILRVMKRIVFLNISAWLMMIPARPEMVLRVTKGDAMQCAELLGGMTSGAAAFEFLVTPLLGRLSDKYGRKPSLLFCTSICFLFRLLDVILCDRGYRAVIAANWLDRLFAGACFPAFFTIARASLTDAFGSSPSGLAKVGMATASWAGLGIMFGPLIGAQILHLTGNPK